jgi:phosphoglycerol transferase
MTGQPPAAMVESLADAGFSGIYIDRFGYADGGAAIEQELRAMLATAPIVSRSGRLSFFALGGLSHMERR